MTAPRLTIIGDDIENPANVSTLLDAANLFAGACVFREHAHLKRPQLRGLMTERESSVVTLERINFEFDPVLTLDNVPGAKEIYGFHLPPGTAPALIVGNERRGVSRDLREVSDAAVQIPMNSRHLNSLNVAAAGAVALYYLTRDGIGSMRTTTNPEKRRPELLFLSPSDHVELGSSIRSAAAFGWQRILVEDSAHVWFGIERSTRAEGRAAARRFRNPIRVMPSNGESHYAFDEVCVITPDANAVPIARANLARGPRQLLIIPDVDRADSSAIDWERFGKHVSFASLEFPATAARRHYRFETSIALAEAARQIGRTSVSQPRTRQTRPPHYERIVRYGVPQAGEIVYLEELACY